VSELVVGALDDLAALRATAGTARVVTYEWEGVPAGPVRALVAAGHVVHPHPDALETAQDRLSEKTTFRSLGIPVARFAPVDSETDLVDAFERLGAPAILKTRRGGYDGKGQAAIDTSGDVRPAWAELGPGAPLILEARVPFDRELSVLAVRSVDGDVRTWPLVENEHRGGILRVSRAPAPDVGAGLQATADSYVRALLEHFDYVGVLTLELFQTGTDLIANEMAPRVHNSGHWTIEGARTSQFANHVRAVLGWPLGATEAVGAAAMVNCIGGVPDPAVVLAVPGAVLHRYGKEPRYGRKVGHVTVVADDPAELEERLTALRAVLPADVG
jgi:5-(carboxyamino)imidazole ribonucleotide synthase